MVDALHFLFTLCLLTSCLCEGQSLSSAARAEKEPAVEGIRMAWDFSTRRQVSPVAARNSGYARLVVLPDKTWFCVFESDGVVLGAKSLDDGNTWTAASLISPKERGMASAVPDVLVLDDGSVLVSYNMRPPGNNTDTTRHFSIRTKRSVDGGTTWSETVELYRAGHEFKNGCWEPAQIQLPSGEVQLFIANEGPYTKSNEQEITMFRSRDRGASWSKGEQVSFSKGYRDGMPAPLLLNGSQEVLVAIEDNGIQPPAFKPSILRMQNTKDLSLKSIDATNPNRAQAFEGKNKLPSVKYGGAPYIRQLPSGEIILSYQSNERRKDDVWDRSDMVVAIGSNDGRNFTRKSIPFYIADPTKTSLWNSISVVNDSTVVALGSTNAYADNTAVWMIKGHIVHELSARPKNAPLTEKQKQHVFIGGYGKTQMTMNVQWDDNALHGQIQVKDEHVFSGTGDPVHDGIRVLLDPQNISTTAPAPGIFALTLFADGKMLFEQGKDGHWTPQHTTGIQTSITKTADGYQANVSIPWNLVQGRPPLNSRIGFHAVLLETTTGKTLDYTEPMAGNITDAPYSWSTLRLVK
ncbi:exo-alpha-sialidase [Chryseolinea lacunae]|uniref:Exo-alpha-sialidase n=1 Tax=Chryseolinea lacunae TaxID=2801331 RepID=A0ABS1KL76_9BACT|nr:exo-alpha-sialidase [Chryseolinea lacunae]MBL0739992.1 exo-alpha-sialidase [Chryseolinea lacunae]